MKDILRAARERARALYDNCLILLQVVDQDGKSIVAVNEQWLAELGYKRNEVLGHDASTFLTEESRRTLESIVLPVLPQSGRFLGVPCDMVKKDGTTLPVLLSAVVERDEQGQVLRWIMVLSDVQQESQAEKLLAEIARGIATNSQQDFFQGLVSRLADLLQVRNAFVTECVNRALTRVRTLAYVEGRNFVENIEYDLEGTPCNGVIGGAVSYYPEQLTTFFAFEDTLASYLGAPCYDSQGNVLGHLAVLDDKPMHCAAQDLAILELFAARAGAELERKQAAERMQYHQEALSQLNQQLEAYNRDLARQMAERTQELERRRQVAEGLRDLLTILNSNRPLQEILDYIVAAASELLGTAS
ncbi:MAG: PAS domain-containing protein, partial [Caldilineaceae bacterium]|nr:PAS domain-containing protein [Caldilineaceae bacterium]